MSISAGPAVELLGSHDDAAGEIIAEAGAEQEGSHVSHGLQTQGPDCCHDVCICCTGQSFFSANTRFENPIDNRNLSGSRSSRLRNPHLDMFLRPPIFS